MSEPLFAAVDAGTTGARAVVVDLEGTRLAEVRRPYATAAPQTSWAEQDPRDWAERSAEALAGLPASLRRRVAAIGLTGQSPSVAPVDAAGTPVGPGLIYRDNRAVAEAAEMRERLGTEALHRLTGHSPEAFHIGPKVLWLRRHAPDVFSRARWYLQPRDVVLHRFCGRILTDRSHANCTVFYDLERGRWADGIFEAFSLDHVFPEAVPSWTVADELATGVAAELGVRPGIPVVIGAGDSQCVAFGTGVVAEGPISEMAGASSCLNSAVDRPRRDPRITHYHHVVPGWYTTELGVNTTGAALAWAVDRLGYHGRTRGDGFDEFARSAAEGYEAVLAAGGPGGALDAAPVFLPYLGDGERDDPEIRATFVGLSDRHGRGALAYAVVEGVAAAVLSVVDVLRQSGPMEELRVSGGGARFQVLGQVKADLLGAPVLHLESDASAVGAALLAASASGHEPEARAAIERTTGSARRFEPRPRAAEVLAARLDWITRLRGSDAVRRFEPEAG